jgi:SNF2 family DNA or RNA helicase
MKRSSIASTPVLLRVSNYPKASLRDGDSSDDQTATESDPELSDDDYEDQGRRSDNSFDLSDEDDYDDLFYHGGRSKGSKQAGKGSKKNAKTGELSMSVDDLEGEATYASSAIAGMFGKNEEDEDYYDDDEAARAGNTAANDNHHGTHGNEHSSNESCQANAVRKKRLDTLLSKTDKIVNRLNEAMRKSMSNVMAAAAEANKADMEMKRKMDEDGMNRGKVGEDKDNEEEDEDRDDEEDGKGPSPVKTRRTSAAAVAAAAAAAAAVSSDSAGESTLSAQPQAQAQAQAQVREKREPGRALVSDSLRDYQSGGVEWLGALHEQGLNGILADEMGLGKTLQVLTFLHELHDRHRLWGPHLIVMPMSVLTSWKTEVTRFVPGTFDVYVHHGPKETRADNFQDWRRRMIATRKARIAAMTSSGTTSTLGSALKEALLKDGSSSAYYKGGGNNNNNNNNKNNKHLSGPQSVCICLTTYDIALKDQQLLQRFGRSACRWGYLIVDEAHRLKNRSSLLFEALAKVNASRRLLLSGTPLQNNLGELWSLLSFILPDVFTDIQYVFCSIFLSFLDVPCLSLTHLLLHACIL